MTVAEVRATTCLAPNTDEILLDLADHLTAATGFLVRFDATLTSAARERALLAGDVDVAWACGLLTMEAIAAGLDVEIVAAPVFAGQRSAVYHSVFVARDDSPVASMADIAGRTLAINEAGSWSGHHGVATHLARAGGSIADFRARVETGSHARSIDAVSTGLADVASIDHTVWDAVAHPGLAVIGRSDDWPAPPFSLAGSLPHDVAAAITDALTGVGPGHVRGLQRIEPASAADYALMRRHVDS